MNAGKFSGAEKCTYSIGKFDFAKVNKKSQSLTLPSVSTELLSHLTKVPTNIPESLFRILAGNLAYASIWIQGFCSSPP